MQTRLIWSAQWSSVVVDEAVIVALPLVSRRPLLLIEADYCEDPNRKFLCALGMAGQVADYLSGRTCRPKWLDDFELYRASLVSLSGAVIRAVGPLSPAEVGDRREKSLASRVDRAVLLTALCGPVT